MRHYPVFLDTRDRRIVLCGGGEVALAKLRLLTRTEAHISVFASDPSGDILELDRSGRIALHTRALQAADLSRTSLVYAADDDALRDAATVALARSSGIPVNVVDDLSASDFITPALVDRAPVTIAIGTEGAAPVLARAIKARIEAFLPQRTGHLARLASAFRARASALSPGRARRDFWHDWFFATPSDAATPQGLEDLLHRHLTHAPRSGHVAFVGAGPGDPDLLTLRARRLLDEADVVIHDRLVGPGVLDLARREALMIDVGKTGFGASTSQARINALLVHHARAGAQVVRLKGGDPAIFGRLDEEIAALSPHSDITFQIVPGITAASGAVAAIGQSLTSRGRNGSLRILTGHDMAGFADHDWRTLARPGEVAAIYMAKRAARFIQGRLLMHGGDPDTPVTLVENASLPSERHLLTTLSRLAPDLTDARLTGPTLMLLGLAPRASGAPSLPHPQEALSL